MTKKLILIDNYDSFTYNLLHYLAELGANVDVIRNDIISASELLAKQVDGVVISPGPASPTEAGICLDVIRESKGNMPIFGVCLGHQSIAQAFGGNVVRARPMHGKTDQVAHEGHGVFAGLPSPFTATRYHSLIAERASLPECLQVTAEIASGDDQGMIMGLQHKEYPIHGVQFHPESIASEHGHALLKNFLDLI